MKKVVLELQDEIIDKTGAMQEVLGVSGMKSVFMDVKDKKLTMIGNFDPVDIVIKLRKLCHAEILTVGPAEEPKWKKEELKKQNEKTEELKKQEEELVKDQIPETELR